MKYYDRALQLARLVGNLRLVAYATMNRCASLMDMGRAEDAAGELAEAKRLVQILEERDTLALLDVYEGQRESELGRWSRATQLLERGLRGLRACADRADLARSLVYAGRFHLEHGETRDAQRYLDEAAELARGHELLVIPGEEIKTDGQGEVIGLFLESEIPRGMSFAHTVTAIKEQGGLVYVPHPFDRLHSIPDAATLHRHLADIDVFEVYNARLLFEAYNDEAVRFVELNVGGLQTKPRAVFCSTQACSQSFGSTSRVAYNVGTFAVVISHRGWKPYFVRHELIHHLQSEHLGSLRVRKVLHAAKHNRLAISLGQAGQSGRHAIQLQPLQSPCLRAGRGVLLAAVQLDHPRTRPPVPVAGHVHGDPVQPRPLLQVANALRRIPHQRPVGAEQRVLGDLLGIVPVASQGVAERIQSILVVVHHPLKDVLHAIHRSLLTRIRRPGLQAIGTAPQPRL